MTTLRFNKPFQVLTQFTDHAQRQTLADFIQTPNVYAAGRLDRDSEGLLLLTDDGSLQHRIAHPNHKLAKTYWVQVDGVIDDKALAALRAGVVLKDGKTKPAEARQMDEPKGLWERHPPVRVRQSIPTSWLELKIREGRNRQVRRMTAAVGFPTLRLIRYAIGNITLDGLPSGEHALLDESQIQSMFPHIPIVKKRAQRTKKQGKGERHVGKYHRTQHR